MIREEIKNIGDNLDKFSITNDCLGYDFWYDGIHINYYKTHYNESVRILLGNKDFKEENEENVDDYNERHLLKMIKKIKNMEDGTYPYLIKEFNDLNLNKSEEKFILKKIRESLKLFEVEKEKELKNLKEKYDNKVTQLLNLIKF